VGIDNRVVDSASIEVNRRQRRAKSDGLGARKLLGMLLRYHVGESKVWSVVRVPTAEEEDRRQLHRELRTLKQERTRVVNRMRGLLASQGMGLPKGRDVRALLDGMRLWDGAPLPAGLRAPGGETPPGDSPRENRILREERDILKKVMHAALCGTSAQMKLSSSRLAAEAHAP